MIPYHLAAIGALAVFAVGVFSGVLLALREIRKLEARLTGEQP